MRNLAQRVLGGATRIVPSPETVAETSTRGAQIAVGKVVGIATSVASGPRAQQLLLRLRERLEQWVKKKVYVQVERLVGQLPRLAKDALEDPDMPRCASRLKDRTVTRIWPEVHEEIMWEVAVLLDGVIRDAEDVTEPAGCLVCAFLRYHMFPCDKGFWGKLRDPIWVLFQLVKLVPVYAVTPAFFLFEFLVIDKGDEFQLIQFILHFKGTQFITHGVLRAIIGFVIFMGCVSAGADDAEHDCENSGPGNAADFWPALCGFSVQVALVWAAFVLLRWSSKKGKSSLKGTLKRNASVVHRPGGYIAPFLWYDSGVVLLCVLAVIVVMGASTNFQEYNHWSVEHFVFAMQVAYGFSAAPFFLFTLPLLQRLLTHALPTAYDRQGRCVRPYRSPVLEKRQRDQCGNVTNLVTDDEARELLHDVKSIFGLGGSAGKEGPEESSPEPKRL